jgi:hypothetical protein
MTKQTVNRDNLAKFIFAQSSKIESYNFDLCHDIAKLLKYACNSDNYRNENGEIESRKPVVKEYYFYIRKTGSFLIDVEDETSNQIIEKAYDNINKYKISISPNCDYLYNTEFATIETLK